MSARSKNSKRISSTFAKLPNHSHPLPSVNFPTASPAAKIPEPPSLSHPASQHTSPPPPQSPKPSQSAQIPNSPPESVFESPPSPSPSSPHPPAPPIG